MTVAAFLLKIHFHFDFITQHIVTFPCKGSSNLGARRWVSTVMIRVMTCKKKKEFHKELGVQPRLAWALLLITTLPSLTLRTNSFPAELQFTGCGWCSDMSLAHSRGVGRKGPAGRSWPWWCIMKWEFPEGKGCAESPLAFCFRFTINKAMNERETYVGYITLK